MSKLSIKHEIRIIWPHKIKIILFTVITAIVSYFLTLPAILPPKFQSVVSLIPPSFNLTKSVNFHKTSYGGFGAAEAEDLERLVAGLKSDSTKKIITKRFTLDKRWGYDDLNDPRQMKKFNQDYNSCIAIKITNLSTVNIEVTDEDPFFASQLAKAFIAQADSIVESVAQRKKGLYEVLASLEKLKQTSKSVQDSLAQLRLKYKIYHLENLSEAFSNQLLQGPFRQTDFHRNYDAVLSMEARIRYLEDKVADLTEEAIFRQENLKVYPSLVNVVSYGLPSLDKVSPNRPLITIISAFIAGIIAILYYLFKGKYFRF